LHPVDAGLMRLSWKTGSETDRWFALVVWTIAIFLGVIVVAIAALLFSVLVFQIFVGLASMLASVGVVLAACWIISALTGGRNRGRSLAGDDPRRSLAKPFKPGRLR
jgi:hypothetical protein